MKKLGKLSLKDLRKEMPVVENQEQVHIYGGTWSPYSIGSADDSYNCHSYAWGDCSSWINDPTNLISAGSYTEKTEDYQEGDKVIYYIDENGNDAYDSGEPIYHSAIVDSVSNGGLTLSSLRSKWGESNIMVHQNYGTPYDVVDTDMDGYMDTITSVAVLGN